MEAHDKIVVVTGAGSGIGRALAVEFGRRGAAHVALVDRSDDGLSETARRIDAPTSMHVADVGDEGAYALQLREIEATHGGIDILCSNAGIARSGGVDAPEESWQDSWQVNLMAHVYGAKAVFPGMEARGGGYLIQTASAAGLLTSLGSAPYAVTKHAAVALAEWMAISYREKGIRVSCLCPQGVRTPMLFPDQQEESQFERRSQASVTSAGEVREPHEVASLVLDAMEHEQFLILPHPEVATFYARRAGDTGRWIDGMIRYQNSL